MYQSALIGLGNIAWKLGSDVNSGDSLCHKNAIELNPKTELVCAFSPDVEEVKHFTKKTGLKGYTDLDTMFQQEQLALVSICSPNEYHALQLEQCLSQHIPMVWLEKPIVTNASDIKKIEAIIQTPQQTTILVNFQRHYTESYQKLKQLIQTQHFGKTLGVEIHYSRGLVTNGSHMLDMLVYLFDEVKPEILWVEQGGNLKNPDCVLKLPNDILVHISGIDTSYHNIDITITCESGRLSILHGGMTLKVEEKIEHALFPGFYRLADMNTEILGKAGFDKAFDNALSDLIDSHESKRQPESNIFTALKGQMLLEEIITRCRL